MQASGYLARTTSASLIETLITFTNSFLLYKFHHRY
nr:MAG TPA: hypothetical protein [Caudoviricetes sp.]